MSDLVKPEEKPMGIEPPKATEEVPTIEETAPAVVTDEVTPVDADKTAEETASDEKKDEKPELKEITHGTLSKAHGGLLALFKQKRFFYFQDEPIPEDKLETYLRKDTASRSIAAYASQTGKGLLLYSKAEGQKVPHGIIKLADVTDVVSTGNNKFILKLVSNELHLESPERDSWVFTLDHKIAEAKLIVDGITNSEGYKASYEKLTKPTTAATAKGQEKAVETKEQESEDAAAKPEGVDIASTSGAEEEVAPKRSPSKKNKKTPRFGFLDKKKKPEEKKEESSEKKDEDPKEEAKPVESDDVPVVIAEGSTHVPTEVKETPDADSAEKMAEPTTASKTAKRGSIFGFHGGKKAKEIEEKKEDIKSETTEPSEVVATEAKLVDASAEGHAAEKTVASSPPEPGFFGRFGKKEKIAAAKTPEKETDIKPVEATAATETPDEPTEATLIVAEESAMTESTSPATSPKEQRRKSFFSFNKKDKKPEEVKSDSEDAEPAQKSGATSPTSRPGLLTGLMRRTSKASKSVGKDAESKEVAAPETVGEEPASTSATSEAPETVGTSTEIVAVTTGDVVPEVVVGQAPVQTTT